MTAPFYSPKSRVNRARDHIRDLERKAKRFFQKRPYMVVMERAADGVNDAHKVKLTKPLPPSLTSLAMEVIEALRAALDHAAYASAVLAGARNPRSICFPFSDNPTDLENTIKKRCQDVPPDILDYFRSARPYQGGDQLLWGLHKACNVTKHRLIVPVGMVTTGMHIRRMSMSGGTAIPAPRWDQEKNEVVFAVTAPGARLTYDLQVSFLLAFGDVEGIAGQPVSPTLTAMMKRVRHIVLGTEARARDAGLIR